MDLSKIQATGFQLHNWRDDLKRYLSN